MYEDCFEGEVNTKLVAIVSEAKHILDVFSLLEVDNSLIALLLVEWVAGNLEAEVEGGLLNVEVLWANTDIVLKLLLLDVLIQVLGGLLDVLERDCWLGVV